MRVPGTHLTRSRGSAAALVLGSLLLTACLTADGTVEADGGATLRLTYVTTGVATEQSARDQLTSPGVTVSEVKLGEVTERTKREVAATLTAEHVDKLEGVPLFKTFGMTIDFARAEDGSGSLTVRLANPKPLPDADLEGTVTVRLTLPGAVTTTSAKKTDAGVEWSFPLREYYQKTSLEMTAAFAKAAPTKDDTDTDAGASAAPSS